MRRLCQGLRGWAEPCLLSGRCCSLATNGAERGIRGKAAAPPPARPSSPLTGRTRRLAWRRPPRGLRRSEEAGRGPPRRRSPQAAWPALPDPGARPRVPAAVSRYNTADGSQKKGASSRELTALFSADRFRSSAGSSRRRSTHAPPGPRSSTPSPASSARARQTARERSISACSAGESGWSGRRTRRADLSPARHRERQDTGHTRTVRRGLRPGQRECTSVISKMTSLPPVRARHNFRWLSFNSDHAGPGRVPT
jgi:hypothetical protein